MQSVNLWFESGAQGAQGLTALILTTIFCWGAWGIFDKKALESASPRDVFLILLLCELPQIPVAAAILHYQGISWRGDLALLLWPALSALTMTASTIIYLMALKETEASYVLGITASYPLVVQLLAVPMVGEPLSAWRLVGAGLIAGGVFAIGFSSRQTADTRSRKWFIIICALASTLAWALYGLFDKKAVMVADPWFVYFWQSLFNGILILPAIALLKYTGYKPKLGNKSAWRFSALSALSLQLGALCYLFAMTVAPASYVIAITGCYPLVMYALALSMLKERINWVRIVGIALVVLGGVVVQISHAF